MEMASLGFLEKFMSTSDPRKYLETEALAETVHRLERHSSAIQCP